MNVSSSRTLTRILRAELDKFMTLPSVWLTLGGTFLLNFGITAAYVSLGLQAAEGTQPILNLGLSSMRYLQAGFMILGILAACSEYSGGQIRTTLTAMPWRGLQFITKHMALTMITIPAALLMIASSVLYTWFRMRDTAAGFDTAPMIGVLAGATGYLTLTALLSAAVGALIRRTTRALVVLLGYYFVVSPMTENSRFQFKNILPETAGSYMYLAPSSEGPNSLTPLQGTGILMVWALIFIAVAVVFYRKRDA